jgi:PPOX class probable F420-dependent enzyme
MLETEQFNKKQYLNLETFRKNGAGVKTPVWFVENNGKLFIITGSESGKIKRIRNNSTVNIAPCKVGGDVLGTWVKTQARIIDDSTGIQEVNKLLDKKYGLMKKLFELGGSRNREKSIAIEVGF